MATREDAAGTYGGERNTVRFAAASSPWARPLSSECATERLIVFSTNDEEFSSAAPKNASRKMREPHRCKTYQPAPSGITTVYLETSGRLRRREN